MIIYIYIFFENIKFYLKNVLNMGIGDWGLGIGDWGLGPIPNPQSPIPNPQSPFNILLFLIITFLPNYNYFFIYYIYSINN